MTRKRRKSRSNDEPSPSTDLKKLAEEWVWKRFGRRGIVMLAVGLALTMIWWNWKEIAKLPGIAEMVKVGSQEPLPPADPERFSIAITHFGGDTDYVQEGVLRDALRRFVERDQGADKLDVQLLHFDRTIEMVS
jgi:hypothetical protein